MNYPEPRRTRHLFFKHRKFVTTLICGISLLAAYLVSCWIFFRIQFAENFSIVFGDRTDGLIQISLLEHWWNVLRGISHWNHTLFFYPNYDTLGYNDGYFLYGMFYSVMRYFGSDPILSSELTNFAIKTIGFFCSFFTFVKIARLSIFFSIIGSIVFTISNNSYVNAYHAQLFGVAFAPCLIMLAYQTFQAFKSDSRLGLIGWGCATSALYGMWLLTTFYMAWFLAFFSSFFFLIILVQKADIWKSIIRQKHMFPAAAFVALVFFLCLLPTLDLYLPTASESGMHSAAEVMSYSPSLAGILNVGPSNWFYGSVDRLFSVWLGSDFPLGGEQLMGMPPVLLMLAVAGGYYSVRYNSPYRAVWISLSITTLATWIFTVHVGKLSMWPFFYHFFPGAKAVRVISRYEIFLTLPIVVLAMRAGMVLSHIAINQTASFSKITIPISITIAIVLVLEQVNNSWPLALERQQEISRVNMIKAMPAQCDGFFTINERPGPMVGTPQIDELYSNNVDAMFIAEVRGWPTLNGLASFVPHGWDLGRSQAVDYPQRIAAFIAGRPVGLLCSLDLRTLGWAVEHVNHGSAKRR